MACVVQSVACRVWPWHVSCTVWHAGCGVWRVSCRVSHAGCRVQLVEFGVLREGCSMRGTTCSIWNAALGVAFSVLDAVCNVHCVGPVGTVEPALGSPEPMERLAEQCNL